jgi:hypothetical protein
LMFPILIAVRTVPSLQPFQVVRVHIISLPASAQLLINAGGSDGRRNTI